MSADAFEVDGYRISPSPSLPKIHEYIAGLPGLSPICVDIGAADGLAYSNTLLLFMNRWSGLAIEAESEAFAVMSGFYTRFLPQVALRRLKVTPANVSGILAQAGIPRDFGFLSLDIDSYDFDVLDAVLRVYRPRLICAEINEKIPPPIRFWVPYRPEHVYAGDHFYGMSLSALEDLARRHDYELISLWFNNAFLVPRESNPWPVQTAAEAFETGYRIFEIPAYNADMVPLLSMTPEAGIAFIQQHFAPYAGRYVCRLDPA